MEELPKVAKGCCQCFIPKLTTKRQKTPQREIYFNHGTAMAIVYTGNKTFSCRWTCSPESTTDVIQPGHLLCYDGEVELCSPDTSTSILHHALSSINPKNLKVWSLEPSSNAPLSYNKGSRVEYATIKKNLPSERDSIVHTKPVLLLFDVTPIHLLSLSLKVNSQSLENESPLLNARWKRQLVGKALPYSNIINTTLFLADDSHSTTSFTINYFAAKTRQTQSMRYFVILPSTRITLQKVLQTSPKTQRARPEIVSLVTKLLIETIQCVAKRVPAPQTFLLSGPPGVGKTFSVKSALAQTSSIQTKLVSLRGSELLQQQPNPAEALQREFRRAWSNPNSDESVVILFLDECDALVSVDSMASMLARLMDQVASSKDRLIIIAATNRVDSIPNMLRRAGRFDCEIPLVPPRVDERYRILKEILGGSVLSLDEKERAEIMKIAELCVGYVPADLTALCRTAKHLALQELSKIVSRQASIVDFLEAAMNDIGASALRDASLAAPPKTTWDDIAGDPGMSKTLLRQAIEWPRLKREAFQDLGLSPPRGILLHGPPGCSKTTLARAAAGASGVAFLSLNPAQVYASSFVGEAESVIRKVFTLARAAAPCILFFDEVDSIFGNGDKARGSSAEARVLSTFLNEMDGIDKKTSDSGVLVLGATNRPWTLDLALLRPGRLGDKIVMVPPPDTTARKEILLMQFPGQKKWDWETLSGILSKGMTGAEIIGACQEAKIRLLKEMKIVTAEENQFESKFTMKQEYLEDSLRAVKPLLSKPEALEEFRIFEHQFQK